eukprot:CFRG0748T1
MTAAAEADLGVAAFSSHKRVENLRHRNRTGSTRRGTKRSRPLRIDEYPALVGSKQRGQEPKQKLYFSEEPRAATLQAMTYKKNFNNYCEAVECGLSIADSLPVIQTLIPRVAPMRTRSAGRKTSRKTNVRVRSTRQHNTHVSKSSKRTQEKAIPCLRRLPSRLIASTKAAVSAIPTTNLPHKHLHTRFGSRPVNHTSLAKQQLHDRIRRLRGARNNSNNYGRCTLNRFFRSAHKSHRHASMTMEPVWKTLSLNWSFDMQNTSAPPAVISTIPQVITSPMRNTYSIAIPAAC